jgi:cytochrome c biogenesis protein CcmG, thiol:disulfide interchange protein DsbE
MRNASSLHAVTDAPRRSGPPWAWLPSALAGEGRAHVRRWWVIGAAVATVVLVAATVLNVLGPDQDREVVDFGVPVADDQPRLPADDGLDVADAPPAAEVPPADAVLADGGWPEAAAFVAREAEAGRPTLVNIFASWCVPCRVEMPLLLEARDANPDVTFLGIDHQDRREDGEAFVEELGVDFATIYDPEGDVAFALGSRFMPTTVIFDTEGRLAGRIFGEVTASSLQRLLDEGR